MKRIIIFLLSVFTFLNFLHAQCSPTQKQDVTTPNNSTVVSWVTCEAKLSDRSDLDNYWIPKYPNANPIYWFNNEPSSTNRFNCHGYAWFMTEGEPVRWVGLYSYEEGLYPDCYITDGSYTRLAQWLYPAKVFWSRAEGLDHSGITTNTPNKIISKWADGPLMEHTPGYGFGAGSFGYYIKTTSLSINGLDTICYDGSYFTLVPQPHSSVVVDWEVTGPFNLSSTTGNSVKVTKTGTGTGNGTLYARIGGKLVDYKVIKPCLTLPSISAPSIICQGVYGSITANNAPNGFTWESSKNITISGSGTTVSAYGAYSGAGWISIKENGKELVNKTVYIGWPIPNISGPSNVSNFSTEYYYAVVDASSCTNSYEWQLSGPGTVYDSYSSNTGVSFSYPNYQYMLRLWVGNSCGQEYKDLYISASSRGTPSYAYPNPVDDILFVDIDAVAEQFTAENQRQAPTYDVRLYDGKNNMLRQTSAQGGIVQFSVNNIPVGLYYLHIYDGVKITPVIQQIMVER